MVFDRVLAGMAESSLRLSGSSNSASFGGQAGRIYQPHAINLIFKMVPAGMAELVDARDSKSRGSNTVPVRLRLPAPVISEGNDWLVPFFEYNGQEIMNTCIFCKIIAQEIPAKVIAQNDHVLVIQDIAPKAPIHYLIITKKHIPDISSLTPHDNTLINSIIAMSQELARHLSGSQSFRLVNNNGSDSGQSVFHLHFHFLSGKKMLDL